MNSAPYIIGTGFSRDDRYNQVTFAELWLRQVRKISAAPIYIVEHDPYACPWPFRGAFDQHVIPAANLGHVHQLIGQQQPAKSHQLCGWSASILLLAMLAYNCEKDLIYVEQDVLVFGDVVGTMYYDANLKSARMVFGKSDLMSCAQSLFLIRHSYIPSFVRDYLSLWPDTNRLNRPEDKFTQLLARDRDIGYHSIGVDRDRPLPWDAPAWYAQHLTPGEIEEAKRRNLL